MGYIYIYIFNIERIQQWARNLHSAKQKPFCKGVRTYYHFNSLNIISSYETISYMCANPFSRAVCSHPLSRVSQECWLQHGFNHSRKIAVQHPSIVIVPMMLSDYGVGKHVIQDSFLDDGPIVIYDCYTPFFKG